MAYDPDKDDMFWIIDQIFESNRYPRKMTYQLGLLQKIFRRYGHQSDWIDENVPEDFKEEDYD
jgi:hypothetical protein